MGIVQSSSMSQCDFKIFLDLPQYKLLSNKYHSFGTG